MAGLVATTTTTATDLATATTRDNIAAPGHAHPSAVTAGVQRTEETGNYPEHTERAHRGATAHPTDIAIAATGLTNRRSP